MSTAQTLEVPGYQVVQYLGSGARSTIWQIRERQSGKLYALKRVLKRQSSDDRFLEQAINEYDVAHQLDHPVIRHIYSIRRIKRWLSLREVHLIMEYCEGRTVQDHRPTSIPGIVRVFTEVASALAYLNAHGYVHADIKPNNIIVSPGGTVKIIDFGQSCPLGTIKQRIQGTPDFIAPEQVHRRPVDARTDVFNFGAALYWTSTTQAIPTEMPKRGPVSLKADMTVISPEQINPGIPPALSKLISDCIETNPAHRPVSMNEVLSRLSLITHTLTRNDRNKG